MPWSVASTTVSALLAATAVATPCAGATAIMCQLAPPSAEVKISFFCVPPTTRFGVQARIRCSALSAPSSAPAGWPSACARPTVPAHAIRPTACQAAMPSTRPCTGPAYSVPSGASRYPRVCVSVREAAPPCARAVSPEVGAPTGVQSSAQDGEEYSVKLVHPLANAAPLPVQVANTANTRSPTVSRAVTRCPWVSTCAQACPPLWVAHSSGPNAHPSARLRNRIWLTPLAPWAAPVSGAGAPVQLFPVSSVRATDVQNSVAQCPGVPACPIPQPVSVPTKVTEEGRKSGGTGTGATEGTAEGEGRAGCDEAADSVIPGPVRGETEAGCPASAPVTGGLSAVKFTT